MSLFGTIQQSSGALSVNQVGLQVVGNNIANANTPGYNRQVLQLATSQTVRKGGLLLGTGVRPTGIAQVVDQALIERMYNAQTALSGAEALERAYSQIEELTNDLNGNGISSYLTEFNNALHELSTTPGDTALRDYVVLQGQTLAGKLRDTREATLERRELWNNDQAGITDEINKLLERIARLNIDIATAEGGGSSHSDAGSLRDQRYQDLEQLAKFLDINIQEQPSGAMSVFVGGDYLVSNGIYREVYTAYDKEQEGNEVRIIETDSPLEIRGGVLAASKVARDEVFGAFVDTLDEIASGLIRGVNEVHSQGQGRGGFQEMVSTQTAVPGVPLKDAGLDFTPRNGTFDFKVVDADGNLVSDQRIQVRRLGQVGDSTVQSIVAEIDSADGVSASVSADGRIEIFADSPTASFVFGEDTSGFLAAAGLNTFFTGGDALDIDVNPRLIEDPDQLAISRGGIGFDTEVLTEMIDLVDRPLDFLGGDSVRKTYEQSITSLGQRIALAKSESEGLRNFHATLESQHLAVSGVNIDEESIKMVMYQRAFQASSKVISTAAEMLELLVNI